jgi:Domain of unknown function (DUF5658)
VPGRRTLVGVSIPCDEDPARSSTAPPAPHDRRVADTDRRALTLRTLFASGLSPRRRAGRRADDHDLPVDFHHPRLIVPAVALLLLSIADAFFTVTLMGDGAQEANPLLAFVLSEHPRMFAAVKMALTGFGAMLLVALARARVFNVVRVSLFLYGLVAVYIALIAYEALLISSMP